MQPNAVVDITSPTASHNTPPRTQYHILPELRKCHVSKKSQLLAANLASYYTGF